MAPGLRYSLGRATGPVLAMVILLSGCGSHVPETALERGPGVTLRPEPLETHFYPLKEPVCTEEDWAKLLPLADPTFPEYDYPRIALALIYHAMRVWGKDCPFTGPREEGADPQQGLYIRVMSSNAEFKKWCKIGGDTLLVPSDVGVHVMTWGDHAWGSMHTSTHFGKYVLLMGEMGIPSDHPLAVGPGKNYVLKDVIVDHAWNVHLADENDWAVAGLAKYLTVREWHNHFGQQVSFDDVAYSLMNRPFGEGACYGTHMPYGLVGLLDAHQQSPILSEACAQAAKSKLSQCGELLASTQSTDGSWGQEWYDAKSGGRRADVTLLNFTEVDRVISTGHHLEWLIMCPPEYRPDELVLARAALYLKRTLPALQRQLKEDHVHWYLPMSHAIRGLLLAHGRRWADPSYLPYVRARSSGAKRGA